MSIEAGLRAAADILRRARSIAAVGHVSPDGDALGSALGLVAAARAAGKQAVASFGEPFVLSDTFGFLPLGLLVPPGEFPSEPEVMVAFDTAAFDRLGSLAPAAKAAKTLIVVDHHESNEGFGDVVIIDPKRGASAELAYLLIKETGFPIDIDAATALYAGIVADTGRFQYSSTSPETLRLAAELMEVGVRPEVVGQNLFEKLPFGYLRLSAIVLQRAELDTDVGIVWSVMTDADLEATGLEYADSDPLIDDVRVAREADVALLLKEVTRGFKGSLRSRGATDVGAIAVELGGGGHHNAAGFTHSGPPDEIVTAVKALVPKHRSS